MYSFLELQQAFSSLYGARRCTGVLDAAILEPDLLPNDLITDYFQSVTPSGYAAFYRLIAGGVEPLLVSKFLPVF